VDDELRIASSEPWGYARTPEAAARFADTAVELRERTGWRDETGVVRLRADLVLEGGGVKGIGLVGAIFALAEAGFEFPRVAGTSAGAIVGAFVAAAQYAGRPLHALRGYLEELHLSQFAQMGSMQAWLDEHGPITRTVADLGVLARRLGIHSSENVVGWLEPILKDDFGVETFADLRIDASEDPQMSLHPSREYRLVVHVSDITRGVLVRLPWDYHYYGMRRDEQKVAEAVRASMSIPIYFEPVTIRAKAASIPVSSPDGSTTEQHYAAGTVTWVDGGLLQNFPIHAFDRVDGAPGRWPTIGIRLHRQAADVPATAASRSTVDVVIHCIRTTINEWDRYDVDRQAAARTIHVDNAGLSATQFELSLEQREALFLSGVRAGTRYVSDVLHSARSAATGGRAVGARTDAVR
jgi:NTE family protein